MDIGAWFVLLGGVFFLAAISLRWDWFRNHYKVRNLFRMLGETGTTVFYIVCGLALVIVGILMMAGVIRLE
jgi:predicted RNA-binding protein with PUA-like domain